MSIEPQDAPCGFIRIFIGSGQGKSHAALGLAFRAVAYGMKSHVIQFLKSNSSSEPLSQVEKQLPLFKIDSFGQHCPFGDLLNNGLINCKECRKCYVSPRNTRQMDREFAELAFEMAQGVARSGEYQVLVLDEVLRAIEYGLLESGELAGFLKDKPRNLEIILTGPGAPDEIVKLSHVVTYFMPVKRPLGQEMKPRRGIDF
ncbi:MAG: cob(I)yrinic acid a,c-diamide adenosyltransferase [Candidatus Eremiobacteraeota bacterium]|nr:cob(I)yrinic acid a,c-diamide adenosyltransferase [Candidatus Eremiobacteraeota bacterium]